jgi:tetratricopeptide (TPR) repeat protein
MALFQIAFGFTVFALTRSYYRAEQSRTALPGGLAGEPSLALPERVASGLAAPAEPSGFAESSDPAAIANQADEYFNAKQYDRAAALYERLLMLDPDNADIYNNLGLTLHYLGRTDEALARLNEGAAKDPVHQRIWLTLGFVNSQLGNVEPARLALTNAVQLGAENDIGRSAAEMLAALP